MTGPRRTCRLTPWIVGPSAVGALLLGGLRIVAVVVGALLALALLADAVPRRRSRRRDAGGAGARRPTVVGAATVWAVVGLVTLGSPAASVGARHVLHRLDRGSSALLHSEPSLLDLLIASAAIASGFAIRSLSAPRPAREGVGADSLGEARAIVAEHGEDSLSPFVLRPDKSFAFAAGGVVAYRVIADTAVVSADPVGPEGCASAAVAQLLGRAHDAGLRMAIYGSSEWHLASYRELGLRAMCVGEEAVVDPARFSLEGRAVRKLRQSVHRVERRGWRIAAVEGREVDAALEGDIDAVERAWRSRHGRLLGFAMSMGDFDPGVRPDDVYLLAWSPEGELRAVMRFLSHRGNLSLDTMRRVGETPNGLNEALICRALTHAREHGVAEVSLNYAGLAHLVRRTPSGGRLARIATGVGMRVLSGRFQMDRLVLFCEKFSPEWRPRYLVYESRACLLRCGMRVLQAEGYLPEPRELWTRAAARLARRTRPTWVAQRDMR